MELLTLNKEIIVTNIQWVKSPTYDKKIKKLVLNNVYVRGLVDSMSQGFM